MSGSNPQQPPNLNTLDSILSQYAKSMKPGETIRIPLYKVKSSTTSIDPFMQARLSKSASGDSTAAPRSAVRNITESFPKVAKFIETVQKPDFQGAFQNGRLYQEDIPKVQVS